MLVRVDYVRVTESSVIANITVQFENKDLQFQLKDGVDKAVDQSAGPDHHDDAPAGYDFRKAAGSGRAAGHAAEVYRAESIYQQSVPLAPGRYRLNIVAKDTVAGNMNNYEVALDVPHFEEDKLASSSLILADTIEKLPTRSIGGGMFAIGDTKVRPRLGDKFKADERMGIYVQFYNFAPDEKTQKPSGRLNTRSIKWAQRIRCWILRKISRRFPTPRPIRSPLRSFCR